MTLALSIASTTSGFVLSNIIKISTMCCCLYESFCPSYLHFGPKDHKYSRAQKFLINSKCLSYLWHICEHTCSKMKNVLTMFLRERSRYLFSRLSTASSRIMFSDRIHCQAKTIGLPFKHPPPKKNIFGVLIFDP